MLVDFLWMLPIAMLCLFPPPWVKGDYYALLYVLYLAGAAVFCAPLVWRRRYPRAMFAIVAVVAFTQWSVNIDIHTPDVAVLILMYTVVAECSFRWGVAAGLVVQLGSVLSTYRTVEKGKSQWSSEAGFAVFIVAIWVWGLYVNTRRRYLKGVEERANKLEKERDAEVKIAAATERARIAREMHDVVAHSISVMVVQADGAAFTVDADPDRARRAMEAIGSTGRAALTEMRRMLGVLREGDGDGSFAPQPGIDQLPDLIENAGLPVELTTTGDRPDLQAGFQLAVYRIVQEALTNTRKHAGPGASAAVSLHYGDHAVDIKVSDDGRGASASDDGRGHGLLGMRERAAVYGGTVHAGPRAGGFEVAAHLPTSVKAHT